MIQNIIFSGFFLSAISLLWRVFTREDFMKPKIEKLPYLIQKPLTCGVCFTFWTSFFFNLFYQPFTTNLEIPLAFFANWMITGMVSVSIYYIFLTFYEGSHYLSHKAESLH